MEMCNRREMSPLRLDLDPITEAKDQPSSCASSCDSNSPKSWEESLQSLSRDLAQICRRRTYSGARSNTSSPGCESLLIAEPSPRGSVDVRPSSNEESTSRQLRVRHEETTEKLRQSLTFICRQNTSSSSNASAWRCEGLPTPNQDVIKSDEQVSTPQNQCSASRSKGMSTPQNQDVLRASGKKSTTVRKVESMKNGLRFKVELAEGSDPDKVAIRIDSNVLSVYHVDTADVIHTVTLTEKVSTQALACNIVHGATSLYVRQLSKDTTYLKYVGFTERYLPVLREDESHLCVYITTHIPQELSFEDIQVKTIDDVLVIKGERSNAAEMPADECSGDRTSGDVDCDDRPSFTVMMNLPEGADHRSVSASISDEHQLVIRASLSPTSRRMTCAF